MVTASSYPDGETELNRLKDQIVHDANALAEGLDIGQRNKYPLLARTRSERVNRRKIRREFHEAAVLSTYQQCQVRLLHRFAGAASAARSGTLVLQEFYERSVTFDERHAALIATILAARAEASGRYLLNSVDGEIIAGALEQAGRELLSARLPLFAEVAFDEAANVHAKLKNPRAEDRCEYLKSGAHRRTYPWWNPMRLIWTMSAALFGYGYKPMRLLIWIAATIAGFVIYLQHLPRENGATSGDAFFMAIQNFVNPMGLGDATQISKSWEPVLEVETYTGDILRNIFFVLLIRRWFRL